MTLGFYTPTLNARAKDLTSHRTDFHNNKYKEVYHHV